ncbi:MAG: polyprenol monophosphomannose synthase [Patescibacteria group bacterium]
MANDVIIILPTYNEAANISGIIKELDKYVSHTDILVVDDNSPDGTSGIVTALMEEHPQLGLYRRAGKEGLGKAYVDAFIRVLTAQKYNWLLMMDSDFSHDPKYIPEMIRLTKTGKYDVIVGSRYTAGGRTEGWEWWRKVLSKFGNLYCRLITHLPINDCTGGFNLIRTEILSQISFNSFDLSGYAFIMELKYKLFKAGARFKEVPILFKNRRGGESKLSNHIIGEGVIAPWKMIIKK